MIIKTPRRIYTGDWVSLSLRNIPFLFSQLFTFVFPVAELCDRHILTTCSITKTQQFKSANDFFYLQKRQIQKRRQEDFQTCHCSLSDSSIQVRCLYSVILSRNLPEAYLVHKPQGLPLRISLRYFHLQTWKAVLSSSPQNRKVIPK